MKIADGTRHARSCRTRRHRSYLGARGRRAIGRPVAARLSSLAVENLRAGYGGMAVLNGVDLRSSELVDSAGRCQRCGQDHALRALCGIIPALGGKCSSTAPTWPRSVSDQCSSVSLVPEGRHLFGGMTVRGTSSSGPICCRNRFTRPASSRHQCFPRLGERLTQAAGTMSGGEQQMVAVGRAMMSRPRLLSTALARTRADDDLRAVSCVAPDQRQEPRCCSSGRRLQALSVADYGYVLSHGSVVAQGEATTGRPLIREAYLGEPLEPENA